MVGVVMQGAEIDGLVTDLVVNGVEVRSYVEAEVDRRHPVWLMLRWSMPENSLALTQPPPDDGAVRDVMVVSGPPGAGKSTVAASLAALLDPSALVAGDDFFAFLRNGAVPPWLEEAHQQNNAVIQAAAAATGQLAGHCSVVYDGVVGPWFLPTFLQASGLQHLHYVILLPPRAMCLQRVQSRVGHGFTDRSAAEHMWRQFRRAEVAPRHVVEDHDSTPDAVARALAKRLREGSVRYP